MRNKRIMYLHGFASSGLSGTVDILRKEFGEDMMKIEIIKTPKPDDES